VIRPVSNEATPKCCCSVSTMRSPGSRRVPAGMRYLRRSAALSLRNHPPMSTGVAARLKSSIQSWSPSELARISSITTVLASG